MCLLLWLNAAAAGPWWRRHSSSGCAVSSRAVRHTTRHRRPHTRSRRRRRFVATLQKLSVYPRIFGGEFPIFQRDRGSVHVAVSASLFRRFTDTNVYGTGSVKIWKKNSPPNNRGYTDIFTVHQDWLIELVASQISRGPFDRFGPGGPTPRP